MNDVHLSELKLLNELSSSKKGSYAIAESFVIKMNTDINSNPWVCFESNVDILANRIYENRGKPLSGLIIGVKDVIATEDFQTSMGAPSAWHNHNMGFDARIVTNFKMAGAIVGGKTKTSEFAVHKETDVINPKYPGMTAGTSSSGSAAAVANGTVKITLGTQTAGSIARPASYCGVNSFKPSFGDFPRTGVLKTSDQFDTLGIFFDEIDTLSIVYDVIAVCGDNYPIQSKKREQSNLKFVSILTGKPFDNSSEIIQRKLIDFAKSLMSRTDLSYLNSSELREFVEVRPIHETLYKLNLAYYFREERAAGSLSVNLLRFIGDISVSDYYKSETLNKELNSWRARFSKATDEMLTITLAANTGANEQDASYDLDCNVLITASGRPQIVLSDFIFDDNGRSIGVSFSGPKNSDDKLLKLLKSLITVR